MSIIARYHLEDLEHKEVPLYHHKHNLQQTASGYGRKLTTRHMVKLPGAKRWRRVYCCQISNSGTCYVLANGGSDWITID